MRPESRPEVTPLLLCAESADARGWLCIDRVRGIFALRGMPRFVISFAVAFSGQDLTAPPRVVTFAGWMQKEPHRWFESSFGTNVQILPSLLLFNLW